jgi:hypothetical protein
MMRRTRSVLLGAISALTLGAVVAPASQADLLSVLPGSCGSQPEWQVFAPWGDFNYYTPVPGGAFVSGTTPWAFSGGATVSSDSGSLVVNGISDTRSLSLPAAGTATSPANCTSIYHPTVRFFVRNTGSETSRLKVEALYPGLLGSVQTATLGYVSGSSSWQLSPALELLVTNLLSTVSLDQTTIAFRFIPADSTGHWSVDDVYLDPYGRG